MYNRAGNAISYTNDREKAGPNPRANERGAAAGWGGIQNFHYATHTCCSRVSSVVDDSRDRFLSARQTLFSSSSLETAPNRFTDAVQIARRILVGAIFIVRALQKIVFLIGFEHAANLERLLRLSDMFLYIVLLTILFFNTELTRFRILHFTTVKITQLLPWGMFT